MAESKRVIWTQRAQLERKKILEYWKDRTESNAYPKKLNGQFLEVLELLGNHPKLGRPTVLGKISELNL